MKKLPTAAPPAPSQNNPLIDVRAIEKKPLMNRASIAAQLRAIKSEGFTGKAHPLLGHKVTAARRFRDGISGQWDAVYVISRGAKKGKPGDVFVMLVDDATNYLAAAAGIPSAKK